MIITEKNKKSRFSYFLLFLSLLIAISFLTLKPSFHLDLTGDDYLGLWRVNSFLRGDQGGNWNLFNYFLTDYGPQDIFTYLIHSQFGFFSLTYYIISYILRILASLSFYPLVFLLTQNPVLAAFSSIIFSVSSTGLETTDWSFNMPSYLSIFFLNIFLCFYLKSLGNRKNYLISVALFLVTIVTQSIRTMFLPLFIILLELWWFIHKKQTVKSAFVRVIVILATTVLLLKTTHIGQIAGGLGSSQDDRSMIAKLADSYLTPAIGLLNKGEYKVLFSPFAQVGTILIPFTLIPQRYELISNNLALFLTSISLVLYMLFVWRVIHTPKRRLVSIFSLLWSAGIFYFLRFLPQYPVNTSAYLPYIWGGYFCIFVIVSIFQKDDYKNRDLLYIASILILTSITIPLLKNPLQVNMTTGRYLIISAVGQCLFFIAILQSINKRMYKITFGLFVLLINIYSSHKYLVHLEAVRNRELAERLRSSIPYIPEFGHGTTPTLFYFEADNPEILQQSLLFGFPVIQSFRHNFTQIWNTAYTTDWNEFEDAVITGKSLQRFGSIELKPVPIDHVYSFKLDHGNLIETTTDTRNRLNELKKVLRGKQI